MKQAGNLENSIASTARCGGVLRLISYTQIPSYRTGADHSGALSTEPVLPPPELPPDPELEPPLEDDPPEEELELLPEEKLDPPEPPLDPEDGR